MNDHPCPERLMNDNSCPQHLYRLMNDFSALLADIHGLPQHPKAFKGHNPALPTDSQHLASQHGRELYAAVASLRTTLLDQNGDEEDNAGSEAEDLHAEQGDKELGWSQQDGFGLATSVTLEPLRGMDSGFSDSRSYSSFVPPDDVCSAADVDMTSLSERFREVNARYDDRSVSCYTVDVCEV
jgi:hypothetical protein